jgi:hypothetical protein
VPGPQATAAQPAQLGLQLGGHVSTANTSWLPIRPTVTPRPRWTDRPPPPPGGTQLAAVSPRGGWGAGYGVAAPSCPAAGSCRRCPACLWAADRHAQRQVGLAPRSAPPAHRTGFPGAKAWWPSAQECLAQPITAGVGYRRSPASTPAPSPWRTQPRLASASSSGQRLLCALHPRPAWRPRRLIWRRWRSQRPQRPRAWAAAPLLPPGRSRRLGSIAPAWKMHAVGRHGGLN